MSTTGPDPQPNDIWKLNPDNKGNPEFVRIVQGGIQTDLHQRVIYKDFDDVSPVTRALMMTSFMRMYHYDKPGKSL